MARFDPQSSFLSIAGIVKGGLLTAGLMLPMLLQTSVCLAAGEAPLQLVWTAPRKCPQHAEVTTRIERLVGSVQERERFAPLEARGVIEPALDQFQLTLLIQDGETTGTRTITSASCRSLSDAAAVVLSLLIRQRRELGRALSNEELSGGESSGLASASTRSDVERSSPPVNSAPFDSATPPKDSSAADSRSTTPDSRNAPSKTPQPDGSPSNSNVTRDEQTQNKNPGGSVPDRGWRTFLIAPALQLEFATLPTTSVGAGLGFGVGNQRWNFFASASLFAPQSKHVTDVKEYDAEFLNRSLSGWFCRAWELGQFQLMPCALVAVNNIAGSVSASASGVNSNTRMTTWLSVGGGLKATLQLTRTLALSVRAAGRANSTRPEFLFAHALWGQHRIHRVSAGSLELSLGCEWSL